MTQPIRWIHALHARVRALARRDQADAQLARDMQFHIDEHTDELMQSGLSRQEATRMARAAFGSVDSVTEAYRDLRRVPFIETLWRDLRYAWRGLRKASAFTLTVVVTLATCLGATLAVFAAFDAILIRPQPFPEADRLVTMYNTYPKAEVLRDES